MCLVRPGLQLLLDGGPREVTGIWVCLSHTLGALPVEGTGHFAGLQSREEHSGR